MTIRNGGKGDKRRPLSVPKEQFENNWDTIFNKPNPLADKIVEQIKKHIKDQERNSL